MYLVVWDTLERKGGEEGRKERENSVYGEGQESHDLIERLEGDFHLGVTWGTILTWS